MKIIDHKLDTGKYVQSPNGGGEITPRFLVMHFTADYRASSAINWFSTTDSKVSAHIVLDRDGTITQMMPFNQRCWHVGKSYWRGYSGLNDHSIGIEIVNYGGTSPGQPRPISREAREFPANVGDPKDWLRANHPMPECGMRDYWWQKYTDAQFMVLDKLVPLIVDAYKIREIVGHEEVATPLGRKNDPGPAFPLAHYKQYADHANANSEGNYVVVVDDLNMRGGPGTSFEIIRKFKRGDSVKVLKFEKGWALIHVDKMRGWVHGDFLMKS